MSFRSNVVRRGLSDPNWQFNANACPQLFNAQGQQVQENDSGPPGRSGDNGRPIRMLQLKTAGRGPGHPGYVDHPERYRLDCATATRVIAAAGQMDTVGATRFNELNRNSFVLYGHWDHTANNYQGGNTGGFAFSGSGNNGFNPAEGPPLSPAISATSAAATHKNPWRRWDGTASDLGNNQFYAVRAGGTTGIRTCTNLTGQAPAPVRPTVLAPNISWPVWSDNLQTPAVYGNQRRHCTGHAPPFRRAGAASNRHRDKRKSVNLRWARRGCRK